jgi:hypothetical protein
MADQLRSMLVKPCDVIDYAAERAQRERGD